ncbi:hypothetical protein [Pseudomonas sp. LF242]
MKLCCACREEINNKATRCKHCSAAQGWRRFIGSPLMLAGFALTLVSIWAAEPVKRLLDPQKAVIQISMTGGDHLHANFMISNNGSRPATLEKIQIRSKTKFGYSTWYLHSDMDEKLLETGKTYIINASNGSLIPGVIEHERKQILRSNFGFVDNCELLVNYIETNGTKVILSYPFMCDPVNLDTNDFHPGKK